MTMSLARRTGLLIAISSALMVTGCTQSNAKYDSIGLFGGDDNGGGSAGDFEGTNFGGDTAKAFGSLSGRSGSVGSDNDRMVTSSGNTQNFNIDYSQPSVTANINGETKTVYGSQANLDKVSSQEKRSRPVNVGD